MAMTRNGLMLQASGRPLLLQTKAEHAARLAVSRGNVRQAERDAREMIAQWLGPDAGTVEDLLPQIQVTLDTDGSVIAVEFGS
jgi:hypothetical protein